jgi:hypothetical protein
VSNPGDLPDDWREYVYSAEPGVRPVDTIELRSPAFLGEDGVTVVPVRLVNDIADFVAKLEADAPVDAGQVVIFKRAMFQPTPPKHSKDGLPRFGLSAENVSALLMPYLAKATASRKPIDLTYRQYRSDQPEQPALIYTGLSFKTGEAGPLRVSADAGFEDFLNMPHPAFIYTVKEYAGLAN